MGANNPTINVHSANVGKSNVRYRNGLALLAGFAFVACDPFPLSKPGPLSNEAVKTRYQISGGRLRNPEASSSAKWSVVDDGFHFALHACTQNGKLCVVGGTL